MCASVCVCVYVCMNEDVNLKSPAQRDSQRRERRWHRWTAPVGALARHRTQPEAAIANQPHRRHCIHRMVDVEQRRRKITWTHTRIYTQPVSSVSQSVSLRRSECAYTHARRRGGTERERETYVFVRIRTSCSDATDNSTACAMFSGNSAVRALTCEHTHTHTHTRTHTGRGTRETKGEGDVHLSTRMEVYLSGHHPLSTRRCSRLGYVCCDYGRKHYQQ